MQLNKQLHYVDPKTVIIEERQRSTIDKEYLQELTDSIAKYGILSPPVVRLEAHGPVLVFGHNRTLACIELGIQMPVFYFEDLTLIEAKIIEFEENVKRSDLAWEDKVRAIADIHNLRKKDDPEWTLSATAGELSMRKNYVGQAMTVFPYLGTKKIEAATSLTHAYNILARLADRRAASIVGELIEATNRTFAPTVAVEEEFSDENVLSIADFEIVEINSVKDNTVEATVHVLKEDIAETITSVANKSAAPSVAFRETASPVKPAVKQPIPAPVPGKTATAPEASILNQSFLEWAPKYEGPKFTVIHMDFPYGVYHGANKEGGFGSSFEGTVTGQEAIYDNNPKIYWDLLDCFEANIDKFTSYSAHVIFWFSMNFYVETKQKLEKAGLKVLNHPFMWHKSDAKGVSPWPHGPKRIYDTAFICSRGGRQMVKQGTDCYSGPTPSHKIHPSEKSEAMLKYFLSSYVDETTTVFDPTCGSAVALRACEDLGAKKILGLEINSEYASAANNALIKSRALRRLK